MTVEIELKFIATPEAIAALPEQLAAWPHQHAAPQRLTNIYFETADQYLRAHDAGLRIRGFDGQYEMTIKTAGRVIGGLHQRPEYNVPLATDSLDLAAFPADIWPEGCDVVALQAALNPLFRTDFDREKWVVQFQDSEIELALDRGEIKAGDLSEALCELELELKQGNSADLLAFASVLIQQNGLRQASLSKAARGYHLAKGNPAREAQPLTVLIPAAKATVEQGLAASMELALRHWQYHEDLWLQGDQGSRLAVIEAVALVRQTLVLFGGIVPRKASNELRGLLTELEPLLEDKKADAHSLCYSAGYQQTKLALTRWLAQSVWRDFIDAKAQAKLDGSFKRFADIMMSRAAAELKEAFTSSLADEAYYEQLPRLTRQVLSFILLAGAYSEAEHQPYIAGWLALQQAVAERRQGWFDASRKHALTHAPFWLNGAPR